MTLEREESEPVRGCTIMQTHLPFKVFPRVETRSEEKLMDGERFVRSWNNTPINFINNFSFSRLVKEYIFWAYVLPTLGKFHIRAVLIPRNLNILKDFLLSLSPREIIN